MHPLALPPVINHGFTYLGSDVWRRDRTQGDQLNLILTPHDNELQGAMALLLGCSKIQRDELVAWRWLCKESRNIANKLDFISWNHAFVQNLEVIAWPRTLVKPTRALRKPNIILTLNRCLKERNMDIIKDVEFRDANLNFESMLSKLKKEGFAETVHYNAISDIDLEKIYSSMATSTEGPVRLYNKVQFDIHRSCLFEHLISSQFPQNTESICRQLSGTE